MGAYGWAWVIAVGAVPAGLFALHRLTRRLAWPRTKALIAVLLAVLLLVPAPVPGYPGAYAPAFVVAIFEWLFQRPGQPGTAVIILLCGTLVTVAAALLLTVLRRRRAADAGDAKSAA